MMQRRKQGPNEKPVGAQDFGLRIESETENSNQSEDEVLIYSAGFLCHVFAYFVLSAADSETIQPSGWRPVYVAVLFFSSVTYFLMAVFCLLNTGDEGLKIAGMIRSVDTFIGYPLLFLALMAMAGRSFGALFRDYSGGSYDGAYALFFLLILGGGLGTLYLELGFHPSYTAPTRDQITEDPLLYGFGYLLQIAAWVVLLIGLIAFDIEDLMCPINPHGSTNVYPRVSDCTPVTKSFTRWFGFTPIILIGGFTFFKYAMIFFGNNSVTNLRFSATATAGVMTFLSVWMKLGPLLYIIFERGPYHLQANCPINDAPIDNTFTKCQIT